MYKLLIVDDEYYAVQGVQSRLASENLGIDEIYTAYSAVQAMEIIRSTAIDLIICDIEMPGITGLELAEWVMEHYPATQTIFLTCHSNFSYAQRAVRLGSFEYLLKPVLFPELSVAIENALEKIRTDQEAKHFTESYKEYYELWQSQKPHLIERFWQDVLSGRLYTTVNALDRTLASYEIPLSPDSRVLPILISVEDWHRELTKKDEEILEYALRNVAEEIFLTPFQGTVIHDSDGIIFVLLFVEEDCNDEQLALQVLHGCQDYKKASTEYFHCDLSCYIGKNIPMYALSSMHESLLNMERDNVTQSNVIEWYEHRTDQSPARDPLPFDEWAILIEAGKSEVIGELITQTFESFQQSKHIDAQCLEDFYYEFIQMVYYILQKNGWSSNELLGNLLSNKQIATRSLSQLRQWVNQITSRLMDLTTGNNEDKWVGKIKLFIREHIQDEISREEIADHLHLNSAYLSRLFKKETGSSLSDYILLRRMELAKQWLLTSDLPISAIAQSLGYTNFSHFAKMFKKVHGANPQDCVKMRKVRQTRLV